MKKMFLLLSAAIASLSLEAQIFALDPMNLEAEVHQNETALVFTVAYNMGPDTQEHVWITYQ